MGKKNKFVKMKPFAWEKIGLFDEGNTNLKLSKKARNSAIKKAIKNDRNP